MTKPKPDTTSKAPVKAPTVEKPPAAPEAPGAPDKTKAPPKKAKLPRSPKPPAAPDTGAAAHATKEQVDAMPEWVRKGCANRRGRRVRTRRAM